MADRLGIGKKKFWSWVIAGSVILTGCGVTSGIEMPFNNDKTITYEENMEYVVNPFMGAVAPTIFKTRTVDGSLVASVYTWDELEKTKGVYDFEALEKKNHYDYWIHQEHNQLMLLFNMDHPEIHNYIGYREMNIPLWLYKEIQKESIGNLQVLLDQAKTNRQTEEIKKYTQLLWNVRNDEVLIDRFNKGSDLICDIPGVGTFYRYQVETGHGIENRGGFSPNYSSAVLYSYHRKIMEQIAQRYDNKETYGMIMGSVGHWGEMHTTYIKDKNATGILPPKAVSAKYEQDYGDLFHNVIVSSRLPREVAKVNNFGLHSHSFGYHQGMYDWYLSYIEEGYKDNVTGDSHPAMAGFWKTAPSGGEFLYTGDAKYLRNDAIEETIQQARDTHLTWFNELWYGLDDETRWNQEYFYSKIGYRFHLMEAAFPDSIQGRETLHIATKLTNTGTAPFYKKWPMVAVVMDEKGNIMGQGVLTDNAGLIDSGTEMEFEQNIELSSDMVPGTYGIYVGILDLETGQPAIHLVTVLEELNNYYKIGEFLYRK